MIHLLTVRDLPMNPHFTPEAQFAAIDAHPQLVPLYEKGWRFRSGTIEKDGRATARLVKEEA